MRVSVNIVVLAGGTSSERDVSIVTSRLVCESLRRNGHNANIVDAFLGTDEYSDADAFFKADNNLEIVAEYLRKKSSDVKNLADERRKSGHGFLGNMVFELCKAADIVFIGLHGANGEDGRIQALFDLNGIKYTGTDYISSAISMNKQITKKMLVTENIPMPKGIMLRKGHKAEYVPFPCVVKPCCGGSSLGVTIANNENEFEKAVELAFGYEDSIMVEEFIKGREFSVGVIDGKALPVIEIEPLEGFYDYKNKYDGSTKETCPANIEKDMAEKMMRWAEKACEAVGITTYARVDEMIDQEGNIFCLEINTLPGMTPTSLLPQEAQAVGMSYDELTQKIIDISLQKYI